MKMYWPIVAAERGQVAADVLRTIGDELAYHVEEVPAQRGVAVVVLEVARERVHTLGQSPRRPAAVEDADIVSGGDRRLDAAERNLAGATDEQNLERHHANPFFTGCRPRASASPSAP